MQCEMFCFKNKHCHAIWPTANRQMHYCSDQPRNWIAAKRIKKCIRWSLGLKTGVRPKPKQKAWAYFLHGKFQQLTLENTTSPSFLAQGPFPCSLKGVTLRNTLPTSGTPQGYSKERTLQPVFFRKSLLGTLRVNWCANQSEMAPKNF